MKRMYGSLCYQTGDISHLFIITIIFNVLIH